jgi:hypothetical protein
MGPAENVKTLLTALGRMGWRVMRPVFFSAYLLVACSFALYSIFEFIPGLLHVVNLQTIRYYAQRAEYSPDSILVFVPRQPDRVVHAEFQGDGYSPAYGVDVEPIQYHASYTSDGFRANSSQPPFDVLVLGDSYIEIGESDDSTFSELLKRTSSLSTLNLGRGWYGPPQYVEVFKRYGLKVSAKIALLCFFSGNDAEDTRQYMRWQRGGEGGDYYSFIVGRKNYFIRYLHAFRDTYKAVRDAFTADVRASIGSHEASSADQTPAKGIHPDLGVFQLDGKVVSMALDYWNKPATSEQLLGSDEWKRLDTVMAEFKTAALAHDILPIIVFIPTKAEVYGSLYREESGQRILAKIRDQIQYERNTAHALESVARAQQIQIVNLLPHFKEAARHGQVLYYPFDTHWNMLGRQAAADVISRVLKERLHSLRAS